MLRNNGCNKSSLRVRTPTRAAARAIKTLAVEERGATRLATGAANSRDRLRRDTKPLACGFAGRLALGVHHASF